MPRIHPLVTPVVALVALSVLTCTPASATLPSGGSSVAGSGQDPVVTTTSVSDAHDTHGALDVIGASHAVRADGDSAQMRFTVRLAAPIAAADLHRRLRVLVAELDTDGRPGSERNITIYGRDSMLRADLISNATREVLRSLHVRLLGGGQTVRVRGPRKVVGARKIFWYSNYHRTGDPECGWDDGYPITCSDSVPDDGWLRLPGAAWPAG
jgi:hypothetical protein